MTSTQIDGRLQIQSGTVLAEAVPISDLGVFYTGSHVESALQEIGAGTTLDSRYLRRANNLSDLANASTARTNLGVVAKAGDTMTGQLFIDGSANEVQFKVQAHSTQTANIVEIQDSSGNADIFVIEGGEMIGIGLSNPTEKVDVFQNTTATSGITGNKGMRVKMEAKPGANSSATITGAHFLAQIRLNNAFNTTSIIGLDNVALHQGTGIVNSATGFQGIVKLTNTGNITIAITGNLLFQLSGSGTITTARGLNIGTPTNTGGGAITNLYGLYISDQSMANTLNYAIYTNAGLNRFGDHVEIHSNKELRFFDNGNYVGFEAPALSADQIWVLPSADGTNGQVLSTDGLGTLDWVNGGISDKPWPFTSPAGSFGTFYYGGFYEFGSTDNDFNPSITFGTIDASRAAHFFLVQAAGASGGTDTVVRITGTSMNDQGVRTTNDTQDLTIDDAGAAGTYYETPEKWVGQITIEKISGPDLLCNYGFVKYWDNNNTNYTILGIEATWLGGANDSNANIALIHHKATGWTYNSGATPTNPASLTDMNTDHGAEKNIVNNENGAWKRDDLSQAVTGGNGEGTIIEIITSANKTFELGSFILHIRSS